MDNYLSMNWQTLVAGIGLLGLSLYQFTTGDIAHAVQSLLAALAAFGISLTFARHDEALVQLKHNQLKQLECLERRGLAEERVEKKNSESNDRKGETTVAPEQESDEKRTKD